MGLWHYQMELKCAGCCFQQHKAEVNHKAGEGSHLTLVGLRYAYHLWALDFCLSNHQLSALSGKV